MKLPYRPLSDTQLKLITAAQHWWFKPRFEGLDNLPAHNRILFVGNHTIYGLLDVPLLYRGIKQHAGLRIRSLGDHYHFMVPGWRNLARGFGVVDGTKENCRTLMEAGEPVLVFPGGGREVCKRKNEAYKLIWKNRAGFANLAAAHDYTIVPFAALGAEECYDIHFDASDVMRILPERLKQSRLFTQALRGGEAIPPVVSGRFYTLMPKRTPFVFRLGTPISTAKTDASDPDQVWALREKVRGAVEAMLATSGP